MARSTASSSAIAIPQEAPRSFLPGQPWLDTRGRRIEAHGGGVLLHQGVYYWYGEDHRLGLGNGTGIHCYSSVDLLAWRDEGVVLPKEALPSQYHDAGACERPKVLYNAKTRRFVMWMHLDCGDGYTAAEAGLATADSPIAPFVLLRQGRPIRHDFGQQEDKWEQVSRGPTYRDMALFQDDDGAGYVLYASENNKTMYVSRLNPEFTWVQEPSEQGRTWQRILIGLEREAPAPFKHGGKYHILSSACTGWGPNPGLHACADAPLGPYRILGDPCHGVGAGTTYGSQPTFVLPAPGAKAGSFIYLADRWIGHALAQSTYVWLPFTVEADASVHLENYDRWDLGCFSRPDRPLAAPVLSAAGAGLRWSSVPGASLYRVYRNGEHVLSTAGTSCGLPIQLAGRAFAYTVVAHALATADSPPSRPVVLTSPEAIDGWLSDYVPESWSQGWGTLRHDLSCIQGPLTLGTRRFEHGFGTHASSRIVFRLGGCYRRLTTWVGINNQGRSDIIASLVGDNRVLASSGLLDEKTGPARLEADLTGVQELVLLIEAGPRGFDYGHVDWCDPWLEAGTAARRAAPKLGTKSPPAKRAKRPSKPPAPKRPRTRTAAKSASNRRPRR